MPDIDDAELEKLIGRLDRADTDRLSDLMRLVGLDPLTDLRGADARGANLSDQDFARADMEGADLHLAQMTRTNLRRAKLRGADLSHANLSQADLSYADLSDANLSHADLSEADLSGALMTGAKLDGANLSSTNFGKAEGAGSGIAQSLSVLHMYESPLAAAGAATVAQTVSGHRHMHGGPSDTVLVHTSSLASSSGSAYYAAASPGYASADATNRAVESAVQSLTDRALQLSEAQSSDTPGLTRLARAHPMSALAMAAGAGFVLARLLGRRG